jgi:hypothetical protein
METAVSHPHLPANKSVMDMGCGGSSVGTAE